MDTLAFGYILPTTGRIPDLHRLETCAAGRTTKKMIRAWKLRIIFLFPSISDLCFRPITDPVWISNLPG